MWLIEETKMLLIILYEDNEYYRHTQNSYNTQINIENFRSKPDMGFKLRRSPYTLYIHYHISRRTPHSATTRRVPARTLLTHAARWKVVSCYIKLLL